jgi:ribosomal protein L20
VRWNAEGRDVTHTDRTIQLLRKGWLTALQSAQQGGCLSLSQRVGELKRAGVEVADKWVSTGGGARVKAYRILKPTRWTA